MNETDRRLGIFLQTAKEKNMKLFERVNFLREHGFDLERQAAYERFQLVDELLRELEIYVIDKHVENPL